MLRTWPYTPGVPSVRPPYPAANGTCPDEPHPEATSSSDPIPAGRTHDLLTIPTDVPPDQLANLLAADLLAWARAWAAPPHGWMEWATAKIFKIFRRHPRLAAHLMQTHGVQDIGHLALLLAHAAAEMLPLSNAETSQAGSPRPPFLCLGICCLLGAALAGPADLAAHARTYRQASPREPGRTNTTGASRDRVKATEAQ